MKQNKGLWFNVLIYITISLMLAVLYDRMYMLNRWGIDDFEHLLAAYFIHNGHQPYIDYFQHHNPLLWYLFSPLFGIIKNPLNSYFIARTIMGIVFGAGCIFIGLIVKKLGGTVQAFLYTLFVYATFSPCAGIYIQTRPDTPMVLCLLMGTYAWVLFYQNHRSRDLFLCYFLYWLAFAFLQKAGLFLLPFGIYQLILLVKKRLPWKQVLMACCLPVVLTGGYILYLYHTGALIRYWELNWILNAKLDRDFMVYQYDIINLIYCFLGAGALFCGGIKGKGVINHLCWVGLGFMGIFALIPKPYEFYWVMMAPMLSMACGFAVDGLIKRGFWTCLLVRGVMGWIMISVFLYLWFPHPVKDIADWNRLHEIIQEIGPDDQMVMYGDFKYAFAKPYPEDYYYFNLEVGALLDWELFHYRELPDWDKIVSESKPKFVLGVSLHNCAHPNDEKCKNEKLMGPNKEFLKEFYTLYYPPFVWKRKE